MTQEAIPVDDTIEPPRICGWCNAPAVDEVILEPERFRYRKYHGETIKELAKAAITAGVCQKHKHIVDRQPTKERPDTYRIK